MRNPIVLFFFIVLTSCMPKDLPTISIMNDEKIEVKFSHQTTKAEMEEISNELNSKYGISMDFSSSTFFDEGKLRDLNLLVTLPNGGGGKTKAMLTNLQYKYFGFEIHLGQNNQIPFKIGSF